MPDVFWGLVGIALIVLAFAAVIAAMALFEKHVGSPRDSRPFKMESPKWTYTNPKPEDRRKNG